MQKVEFIAATNAVITLADGSQEVIADSALENMATQLNSSEGMPQLLEHDWMRPIGWISSARTVRIGDRVELHSCAMVPETQAEWNELLSKYEKYLKKLHVKKVEVHSPDMPTGIDCISDIDCLYWSRDGFAHDSLPVVFDDVDDDGLSSCRFGKRFETSWRAVENKLLTPHRLFRRGFGFPNRVNGDLAGLLYQVADDHPELSVRIRWDRDCLGMPSSVKETMQRDYWWGPPYKGDPFSHEKGVSIHGPTKYDYLNGLIRSEFWWYGTDELVFEMEELIEPSAYGLAAQPDHHGVRFVHSVFSYESRTAVHLDGAIRFYSKELWEKRVDPAMQIRKFGKKAVREKLWRIDGEIPMDVWYGLIHAFFRGNFTVAEYFGLGDPVEFRDSSG